LRGDLRRSAAKTRRVAFAKPNGGQLDAGFQLVGFFEDGRTDDPSPIHALLKCYGATRALKA
jgi:hypothetical protein